MARVLWVNRCRKPGALVGDPDSVFLSSTSRKSSPLKVSQGKNPSPTHIHGVIDAEGMVLGRLATEVAKLLRGKHKPTYTPFLDTGDNVIVINASKVVLTGKKLDDKLYRHHSGFPGGLKEVDHRTLMAKNPEKAVELAVKGMLPKNSLGRQMFRKLHSP